MQSPNSQLFHHMLNETRGLLQTSFPEIDKFVKTELYRDLPFQQPSSEYQFDVDHINNSLVVNNTMTSSLLNAIIAAKDLVKWQQSYTNTDGFDAGYLSHYGWFNLVSPSGPFTSQRMRISVGYWGEGLYYKEHWHEPEEYYLVLAGEAVFHSKGCEPRRCQSGDIIFHHSNQPHSINMVPGPLLAMAFWRGNNLEKKSGLPVKYLDNRDGKCIN